MFLVLRDDEPVGVYDKIQDLVKDVEERMIIDYSAFERSDLFNQEQFELEPYLDVKVLVCRKNNMSWVNIDFTLDEINLYDFLNEESSQVVDRIEKYNEEFLIAV
jgi:hypothetical protein